MLRQRGLDPIVELALEAEERSPNLEEQEMNVCLSTTPHPIHSAFSVYWSLFSLQESLSTLEVTQLTFL